MKSGLSRYFLTVGLIFVIVLIIEGGIFNYLSITTRHLTPVSLDLSQNESEEERELLFDNIEIPVYTAHVVCTGNEEVIEVRGYMTDDASRDSFAKCYSSYISPGSDNRNDAYLRMESNGICHSLKFLVDNENTEVISVDINTPYPYHFSLLRFAIIFALFFAVFSVRYFKAYRIVWNPKSRKQCAVYVFTALICIFLSIILRVLMTPFDSSPFPLTKSIAYPFEDDVEVVMENAHAVMFDSLMNNGIVYVEPDERLKELENPYDPTERATAEIKIYQDYAYHNGNYYVYFGTAPVLTFYYPYYLVFGRLPSYLNAAVFFAVLTMTAGFLCLWEWAGYLAGKISALCLYAAAPAVVLGSNVLMLQSHTNRYNLAIASFQAFFFLTLWAGHKAVSAGEAQGDKGTVVKKSIYFFLCAVFLVLVVWSRPLGLIPVVCFLAPAFVIFLYKCRKDVIRHSHMKSILFFVIPVLIGAAVTMYYNNIRFESPFEFGQFEQLTLEDIHYNRLKIKDILPAVWYFFFDGLSVSSDFPWFSASRNYINYSGNYFLSGANVGAMVFPITWGLLLYNGNKDKTRSRSVNFCFVTAFLSTLFVAWMDYDYAGVEKRYVSDILPTLCLIGGLLLVEYAGSEILQGRLMPLRLLALASVVTVVIAICLALDSNGGFVYRYDPGGFLYLFDTFSIK